MKHREEAAQKYLDALDDPQCFCDGRLSSLKVIASDEPITLEPNCACRNECRMFNRRPSPGKPIKIWRATSWRGDVCEGRQAWQEEKDFQQWQEEVDAMEWIVTIGDRSWSVKKTTASMALMFCMVELRREGMGDDEVNRIFNQKLYQIREA